MTPEDWTTLLDGYQRELELEGFRPRTITGRLWIARKFAEWCRKEGLSTAQELSAEVLTRYRRRRMEGTNARGRRDSPFTVNLHFEGLRDFLGRLSRRGLVSRSLLECLRAIRKPKRLPKGALTYPEMVKILDRIPGDTPIHMRDRAVLEVLYSTAVRRQELVQVHLRDVDLEAGFLRVEEGKGGKGRVVPLGRVAGEWVDRYLRSARPALVGRKEDAGILFLSKSGRPLNGNSIREIVLRWTKASGIGKEASPHTLRRSCATGMIRNRANPAHVKDLLGHEDFGSLAAYVRLEIQDLKDAHRRFHPREQDDGMAEAPGRI